MSSYNKSESGKWDDRGKLPPFANPCRVNSVGKWVFGIFKDQSNDNTNTIMGKGNFIAIRLLVIKTG